MKDTSMMPLVGMDTQTEDSLMRRGGDEPRHFLRDAVNIDLSPGGKASLRKGLRKISDSVLFDLWHSRLHGDTFARDSEGFWVRLDSQWQANRLIHAGDGPLSCAVVNNRVIAAGANGVFEFTGSEARRLTLPEPPSPALMAMDDGSLIAGRYGVAVSFMRGDMEGPLSAMSSITLADKQGISVSLPMVIGEQVTGVRMYMTRADGGELLRVDTYNADTYTVDIPAMPTLGAPAPFRFMAPMPTGKFLRLWRGRLLTTKANVIQFSQPMAYHVHDPRYDFIAMPQRVTFVEPVDGGLWVGQSDHVVFLEGNSPEQLAPRPKAGQRPIPASSMLLDGEQAEAYDQGGQAVALWLADNGYAVGTAGGSLIENTAGRLAGISGESGHTVAIADRVLTVLP